MNLADFAADLRKHILVQKRSGNPYLYLDFEIADLLQAELENLPAATRCDCGGSELRCCKCGKYLLIPDAGPL